MSNTRIDGKTLGTKISKIAKAVKSLRDDIQECAVHAIEHVLMCGDVVHANNLYNACGKSTRRAALVKFMEINAPLVYMTSEKKFKLIKERREEFLEKFDFDELMLQPWEEAEKEKIASIYDADKMVSALIDKLIKESEKGGAVKNIELVQYIADAKAKYHRDQMEKNEKEKETVEQQ